MRWDNILGCEGQLLREIYSEDWGVNSCTMEQVLLLAIEISREGRKVGTMFVIADEEETLKRSRCLILDPLKYHPDDQKQLDDPNVQETVKEFAQLDGAFIISETGIILSACRYINASSEGIDLPLGLGSRHMAAASITKQTDAVAVVVSESSVVRIFDGGEIVCEIVPELWLLKLCEMNLEKVLETEKE